MKILTIKTGLWSPHGRQQHTQITNAVASAGFFNQPGMDEQNLFR
jgi:hypothetical protein